MSHDQQEQAWAAIQQAAEHRVAAEIGIDYARFAADHATDRLAARALAWQAARHRGWHRARPEVTSVVDRLMTAVGQALRGSAAAVAGRDLDRVRAWSADPGFDQYLALAAGTVDDHHQLIALRYPASDRQVLRAIAGVQGAHGAGIAVTLASIAAAGDVVIDVEAHEGDQAAAGDVTIRARPATGPEAEVRRWAREVNRIGAALPGASALQALASQAPSAGVDLDLWVLARRGVPMSVAAQEFLAHLGHRFGWVSLPADVAAAVDPVLAAAVAAVAGGPPVPAALLAAVQAQDGGPMFFTRLSAMVEMGQGRLVFPYPPDAADLVAAAVGAAGDPDAIRAHIGPLRTAAITAMTNPAAPTDPSRLQAST